MFQFDNATIGDLDIDFDDLLKQSIALINSAHGNTGQFHFKSTKVSFPKGPSTKQVVAHSDHSDLKAELESPTNDKEHGDHPTSAVIDVTVNSFKVESKTTWFGRSSDFADGNRIFNKLTDYYIGSFDKINSHTHWESKFIPAIYYHEIVPISASTSHFSYLAMVCYEFPFPLTNRVFYELIHIHKLDDSVLLIQVPVHPDLYSKQKKKYPDSSKTSSIPTQSLVHGKYTSIEKISLDKSSNVVNWTMMTIPAPGGNIPHFLTKMSISKEIAKDVPHFLEFIP
jgi:hypothetical protein